MSSKQTRKTYPKEFKEETVALVTEQGYSVSKAAESVGTTTGLLYKWKEEIKWGQIHIKMGHYTESTSWGESGLICGSLKAQCRH